MLMSSQASRYAHQLLKAREEGALIPLLSSGGKIDTDDAYDIAHSLLKLRIAQGEMPLGRAIVFSNTKLRSRYGKTGPVASPFWAPLFDTDMSFASDNIGKLHTGNAPQPRIAPQLVLKLESAPTEKTGDLADCIAWIAPGFTLASCPFQNWEFDTADAIAAFGLQRRLVIGEPKRLHGENRQHLREILTHAGLSLSRTSGNGSGICAAGWGSDLMGGPLAALHWLQQRLASQPAFPPLKAGEIIATGSWTDPQPVAAGDVWASAFSQLNLSGLRLCIN